MKYLIIAFVIQNQFFFMRAFIYFLILLPINKQYLDYGLSYEFYYKFINTSGKRKNHLPT